MTRAVTLLELRTRSLAAADMPQLSQAGWCPTSEVNLYINNSAADLHDQLVLTFADYALRTVTITITAGLETYPLPEDFYKVRGVNTIATDGTRLPLTSYGEEERASLYSQAGVPYATRYRVEDGNVVVLPVPAAGTLELRYAYQYPWLSLDTEVLSFNVVSGWDELIVYDVAAKLRIKGSKDAGQLLGMVDRLRARVGRAAPDRQADGTSAVRDSQGRRDLRRRCLP